MAVIDSLLVQLGFEYDEKQARQFEKGLSRVGNAVKKIAVAAGTAAVAMGGLTIFQAGSAEDINDFAASVDESVQKVDALRQAFSHFGLTAEDANGLLLKMSSSLQGLDQGKITSLLGGLGISTEGKSAAELTLEALEKISKLGADQQRYYSERLGIDPQYFQQALKNIDKLRATYNQKYQTTARTQGNADSLTAFNQHLKNVRHEFSKLSGELAESFLPVMKKLTSGLLSWFRNNREEMAGWLDTFANFSIAFAEGMGKIIDAIKPFMDWLFPDEGTQKAMNNSNSPQYKFGSGYVVGGQKVTNLNMNVKQDIRSSDPQVAANASMDKILTAATYGRVLATER